MALFEQVWAGVEPKRRRQLIERLVELAEGNFELDFDSIFRYCLKDEDAQVQCKAIEGLWENEEASLISPLTGLLEQDSSAKVQAAAAMALGRFAMLAELGKLRSCHASTVSHALLKVLNNKSKPAEVRRRALDELEAAEAPLSFRTII